MIGIHALGLLLARVASACAVPSRMSACVLPPVPSCPRVSGPRRTPHTARAARRTRSRHALTVTTSQSGSGQYQLTHVLSNQD
eukprot:1680706-Prymnesium_polylepis.1